MRAHPFHARIGSILASAVVAFVALACGPKPTNEPLGRGVLLIAIDGLRADHMSAVGYDRPTTPVLDALARQGTLFTNAWSAAPRSVPAHAALLTGSDPWIVRRDDPGVPDQGDAFAWRIPEEAPRLAQELLAHGYATAAFITDPALSPVSGFDAGFQAPLPEPAGADATEETGFDVVSERFVNWLFEKSPSQDWFAYLEVDELVRLWDRKSSDPRWDTYFPPRASLESIPPVADGDEVFFAVPECRWQGGTHTIGEYEARYDGALFALDAKLGQLFERLRRTGRLKNTTVVVSGTFGTSFGESGLYLASGTLTDADLHVPLFIRPPLSSAQSSTLQRAAVSDALVSTLDVAPTILAMARLEVPQGMHGVSLLGILGGQAPAEREAVFASGGLFPGWVAIDDERCFERTIRAGTGLAAASWSGERNPVASDPALSEHLHLRRDVTGDRGHLGHGTPRDPAGDRLVLAGQRWFSTMDLARVALQGPAVDGSVARSPRVRRLLGD